jgi:hypothetical protein
MLNASLGAVEQIYVGVPPGSGVRNAEHPARRSAQVGVGALSMWATGSLSTPAAYGAQMAAAGKKLHGHGARRRARSPAASVSDGGYGPPCHPVRVLVGQRFWPRYGLRRRPFVVFRVAADGTVYGRRLDSAGGRVKSTALRLTATRVDGEGLYYVFLGWSARRYRTWAVLVGSQGGESCLVFPEWHPARCVVFPRRLLPPDADAGAWMTVRASLSAVAGGQLNPCAFACCEDPGVERCPRPAVAAG